jgi:phosphate transport system permease protein
MVAVLGGATLLCLAIVAFIIGFVLEKGLPQLSLEFLISNPRNMGKEGGILPTIVGSLILPLMAIVLALPLGVGTAIYLSEYTRETRLTRAIRFGTDCLAGIPSIIFGLFGFIFFVTVLGMGWSLLAGALTLAIMVLPTIIRTSEEAIRSVPESWREVSLSLGATRWETVRKVVLPNALPGIVTGVMLSIGRSIGETAAVIFTAGSSLRMPKGVFDSVRTMAVHSTSSRGRASRARRPTRPPPSSSSRSWALTSAPTPSCSASSQGELGERRPWIISSRRSRCAPLRSSSGRSRPCGA